MENVPALETVNVSRAYLNAQSQKIKELEAKVEALERINAELSDARKGAACGGSIKEIPAAA